MSPRPPADTSAPPDGPRRVVLVGRLTRSSPVRLRWPVRVPARMNGAEETGDAGARCVDSRGQQGRRDTRFGPSYGKTASVVLFGADSTSDGDQMGSHRVIAQGTGCHRVTAVLTATSSTVPHLDTTRRTSHVHVMRSGQGSACIC